MDATSQTNKERQWPKYGVVVAVCGTVVDVHFDTHLPQINTLVHAGEGGDIVIEELSQRDAHRVRRLGPQFPRRDIRLLHGIVAVEAERGT